jgi:predicted hydrocarbon binding protein
MKKELMHRRELLGGACGIGACSCIGVLLGANKTQAAQTNPEPAVNELKMQNDKLKWWAEHTKKQLALLWQLLENHLDEGTRNTIIEQLGRNCAKSLGWPARFRGNPEGFFEFMKQQQGEKIVYDKERGVIMVETPQRDCVCGMVNSKITPSYFCRCSVGWQKEMYETILGKSVDCEVVESVLRGSKRCVFKNTIKG